MVNGNNEVWESVVGYDGRYMVSNIGRVYSIKTNKYLKQNIRSGYPSVKLQFNCSKKTYSTHRLVAAAFIKNESGKREVNHRDGDKENNHVLNLEWATPSENMSHAVKNGLVSLPSQMGESHSQSKLTNENVILIRLLGRMGKPINHLSAVFGVSSPAVSMAANYKRWNHLP